MQTKLKPMVEIQSYNKKDKKWNPDKRVEGNALDSFQDSAKDEKIPDPDALGLDMEQEPEDEEEGALDGFDIYPDSDALSDEEEIEAKIDAAVEKKNDDSLATVGKPEFGTIESNTGSLVIDLEFSNLMPPLTAEEYGGLEKSILARGFDESLGKIITWKESEGSRTIIEGMNRYNICTKHGKQYATATMSFPDRDAVKAWIISNQLDRRNLTPEQRKYLIGKRYEAEKKPIGAQEGNDNSVSHGAERITNKLENKGVKLAPLIKPPEKKDVEVKSTAKKIAEKAKVSEKTVKEASNLTKATDTVAQNTGMKPQELLSRDLKLTEKDIKDIAKLPPETQKETIEKVKEASTAGSSKKAKGAVQEAKAKTKREEQIKQVQQLPKAPAASQQRVVHGDFNTAVIEPASIDLAVTSPPYNLDKKYSAEGGDNTTYDEYLAFTKTYLQTLFTVLKDSGRLCLNVLLDMNKGGHHPVCADVTRLALEVGFQYHSTIIWNEGNISSGTAWGTFASAKAPCVIAPVEVILILYKKDWQRDVEGISTIKAEDFKAWTKGVWSFKGESAQKIGHPAPFPEELPRRCIELFTFAGDTVLDAFLGSGTTLVVCAQTGRKGIGFDINNDYCELAKARIAKAEAEMAEKKKE